MPVSERTSISDCFAGSSVERPVTVATQPATNASGIDTMPGFDSGHQAKFASGNIAVGEPDTTGENTISRIADASPTYMLHSAPRVVNRFQNSEYTIVGRFADAATANASATRNATFCLCASTQPTIATGPIRTTVRRATRTSEPGSALPFLSTFA